MTERDEAVALANRVLDRPSADYDDDLATLAREFLRALEEREWRPIETAPRDGTEIDVWQYLHHPTWGPDACRGLARGWLMPRVRWFSGTWRCFAPDVGVVADDEYCKISHWMPLPGPPK